MKKILITYQLKAEGFEELEGKYEITQPVGKSIFTKEEVMELIPQFEILIPNFSFYTDKDIIDKGTKLELISNYGVGYNNIDVDYATK